ncbi:MAG: YihY/virulence factor BrkB family protein [Nocardioidaceae bacterium]
MAADSVSHVPARVPVLARWRAAIWRLLTATVSACFRYRVTGLAAEAAFFAILSLPPLIFGVAGTIGYVAERYNVSTIDQLKTQIADAFGQALTSQTVDQVINPTLNEVFAGGRIDVISIGFVLALWSGSRALNVFVDTITIMYGLGGRRGIVKTRALSFSLYVVALCIAVVALPLILAGPSLVGEILPKHLQFVMNLYWPTVLLLSIAFLTTLYHLSVPVRTSWRYDIPGAVFTLLAWLLGSYVLRWALQGAVGGSSIYGPLSAPIAVLIWLYFLSIAVLIGAAVNASFDRVFPANTTTRARIELVRRLRLRAAAARLRDAGYTDEEVGEGLAPSVLDEEIEERTRRVIEDARRRREPAPEDDDPLLDPGETQAPAAPSAPAAAAAPIASTKPNGAPLHGPATGRGTRIHKRPPSDDDSEPEPVGRRTSDNG